MRPEMENKRTFRSYIWNPNKINGYISWLRKKNNEESCIYHLKLKEADLLWAHCEELSWKIYRCSKAESSLQLNSLLALAFSSSIQSNLKLNTRRSLLCLQEFEFLKGDQRERETEHLINAHRSVPTCGVPYLVDVTWSVRSDLIERQRQRLSWKKVSHVGLGWIKGLKMRIVE